MRCRQCEYPLWNLAARQCPECGADFRPSEFMFPRGEVRFCCPHCDQQYFGTSATGHLVPFTFECCGCQRAVNEDEMIIRALEGETEAAPTRTANPWARGRGGRFASWWRTLGNALVAPQALMDDTPHEGIGRAAGFATIVWLSMGLLSFGLPIGGIALILMATGDPGGAEALVLSALVTGSIFGAMLVASVLWALVTHGVLMLTGGCTHSFARTQSALLFSSAAMIFMSVPCLGLYVGWMVGIPWWIVSAVIMVMTAQRVSGGRATLAVLLPPSLAIIAFALYIGVAIAAAGNWATMGVPAMVPPVSAAATDREAEGAIIAEAFRAYTAKAGRPAHPALLLDDRLNAWDFVCSDTETYTEDAGVGTATLEDLENVVANAQPGRRDAAIEQFLRANNAWPESPPTCLRVGDIVFTYFGLPDSAGDRWIAVLAAHPDVPQYTAYPGWVTVELDGDVAVCPPESKAARLELENAARAELGLTPLPNPDEVRDP